MDTPLVRIDAAKFQKQLGELAETVCQKVLREGPGLLPGVPKYVCFDMHVLIRQVMRTYDLFFFINADERVKNDPFYRLHYSAVILPLIRNMIDCLYNVTAILQNPGANGPWYRKSGYKNMIRALEEDEDRYGGRPEWDEWLQRGHQFLNFEIRKQSFDLSEVLSTPTWPTLGRYLRPKKGVPPTPHQDFLRLLTYGPWREYSAMAHGGVEGLARVGLYYITDSLLHEQRDEFEAHHPKLLFMHISRAAAMLLCIVTEAQAYFRFDGARINERICEVWEVLKPGFEVKELYDRRYAQLMNEKGISAGGTREAGARGTRS